MSGATLATLSGYKNQSAIGNLENRPGGTGGKQIGRIADALKVSVDWLLRGPDGDDVPFLDGFVGQNWPHARQAAHNANEPARALAQDPVFDIAVSLLAQMSPAGRDQSITYLRYMVTQHAATPQIAGGKSDSVSHPTKAA